jgi:hypothetical protein
VKWFIISVKNNQMNRKQNKENSPKRQKQAKPGKAREESSGRTMVMVG